MDSEAHEEHDENRDRKQQQPEKEDAQNHLFTRL
jgi:hypothetical protein